MANSLRAKLSKLRHERLITEEEYQAFIKKLDGHDKQIRAKAFDDVLDKLNELLLGDCPKGCNGCCEQDFCPYDECNKDAIEIVKQLKGE